MLFPVSVIMIFYYIGEEEKAEELFDFGNK